MIAAIVRFSIRHRGMVIALSIAMTAYGAWQLSRAGLDIFPEFSPKAVIVQTEAPGLPAERVEVLVSRVVENAMNGLNGLDHVRSESIEGLSIVTVVFRDDTDVYRNRQLVVERLATVTPALPQTARAPVAVPLSSSSATVRTIGVESDVLDLTELRALVDLTIVPRLLSVPGIADVNVFGGAPRALRVELGTARLVRNDVAITDVVAALERVTGGAALGVVETPNQRLAIDVIGLAGDGGPLEAVVVRDDERGTVRVGDVARVALASEPPIGAAQIGGKPAIVMMVIGQFGANTLTVSNRLRSVLADFERNLAARGGSPAPEPVRPRKLHRSIAREHRGTHPARRIFRRDRAAAVPVRRPRRADFSRRDPVVVARRAARADQQWRQSEHHGARRARDRTRRGRRRRDHRYGEHLSSPAREPARGGAP